MTELEKQFFDTFEIEPDVESCYRNCYHKCETKSYLNCKDCNDATVIYPQITDNALLELILINMHNEDLFGYPTNIQELKDNTLKQLIETYNKFSTCVTCDGEYQQRSKYIKQQVQDVFKDGK